LDNTLDIKEQFAYLLDIEDKLNELYKNWEMEHTDYINILWYILLEEDKINSFSL
jgi:hypothetical protein